jgi:hypothetical protein
MTRPLSSNPTGASDATDDELARRGHAIAAATNSAMKSFDATMRLDAEEKGKEEKEKERKDADAGEKLDKLLTALDGLNSRFDAISSRMDAYEEAGKALKLPKDGAEAAMDKKKDGGEEVEEKGDPKELKADRRSDSLYDQHLSRADSDENRDEKSQIWTDAERSSSAWNNAAVHPWDNERPDEYRRRVAHPHKQHSPLWKEVNLKDLSGQTLKNATAQIFKDSYDMACSNEPYAGTGGLREVRRVNRETGHIIKEFYGDPMQWMQQFTGGRRLARFHLDADHRTKR